MNCPTTIMTTSSRSMKNRNCIMVFNVSGGNQFLKGWIRQTTRMVPTGKEISRVRSGTRRLRDGKITGFPGHPPIMGHTSRNVNPPLTGKGGSLGPSPL